MALHVERHHHVCNWVRPCRGVFLRSSVWWRSFFIGLLMQWRPLGREANGEGTTVLRESSLWKVRERIGSRLRTLREKSELTLEDLAGRSGVGEYEIGFLERGRRSIRFESLLSLADALGVPVLTFFE